MRIAVLGTGKMGTALGERLALVGHEVRVGSRDPERGKDIAAEIGASFGGTYADAVADSEALILAVPWSAAPETLIDLGDLGGSILIDITNPAIRGSSPRLEASGAELLAQAARNARVVKAWNTLYSEVVRRPGEFEGMRATVFVAGDDADAKDAVSDLVRDIGYDPADAGPLSSSRYLEPLASLMARLDKLSGGRVEHGLKLLRRTSGRISAEQPDERPLALAAASTDDPAA